MVYPEFGVNYNGLQAQWSSHIAFLQLVGVPNIRIHIPGPSGYTFWRLMSQTFAQAGFWTTYGSTQGTITTSNWQAYHDAVISEATYCQANAICTEFEVGNELDQSINYNFVSLSQTSGVATAVIAKGANFQTGESVTIADISTSGYSGTFTVTNVNSTTFTYPVNSSIAAQANTSGGYCFSMSYTQLYTNLQQLCLDVQAVFSGPVSYAISAQYPNAYTSWEGGVGNFNNVSVHPYATISGQTVSFTNTSNILAFANTYFGSNWYTSEFNLSSSNGALQALMPSNAVSAMNTMIGLIQTAGANRFLLYTFVGSSNTDNQFVQLFSTGSMNPMWFTFFESNPTEYAIGARASESRTSVSRTSVSRSTVTRPLFNSS